MKTISATEAQRRFGEILDEVSRDRVSYLVTRYGKPIVRIVPPEEKGGRTRRTNG